jgi:hypothetical protein
MVCCGLACMDNTQVAYKKDFGNMLENYLDYLQMVQQNQNHHMIVLRLTRKDHPMKQLHIFYFYHYAITTNSHIIA